MYRTRLEYPECFGQHQELILLRDMFDKVFMVNVVDAAIGYRPRQFRERIYDIVLWVPLEEFPRLGIFEFIDVDKPFPRGWPRAKV
jgi:hypothetical protein